MFVNSFLKIKKHMARKELNLAYIFSAEFAVRDYECDIQGNNRKNFF